MYKVETAVVTVTCMYKVDTAVVTVTCVYKVDTAVVTVTCVYKPTQQWWRLMIVYRRPACCPQACEEGPR